jgi:hypothetical protein
MSFHLTNIGVGGGMVDDKEKPANNAQRMDDGLLVVLVRVQVLGFLWKA